MEMCIIFAKLTWPENPADAISEVLNSKIFFRTLTFRTLHSTIYAALPVPEQLPYSGYATGCYVSKVFDYYNHVTINTMQI